MALSDDLMNRLNVMLASTSAGAEIAAALVALAVGSPVAAISDDARNRIKMAIGNSNGEQFLAGLLGSTAAPSADIANVLNVALASATAPSGFFTLNLVSINPTDQLDAGVGATFTCQIRGADCQVSYQWQRSTNGGPYQDIAVGLDAGVTYTGSSGAVPGSLNLLQNFPYTLTLNEIGATTPEDGNLYRCLLSNLAGSEYTGSAKLTVLFVQPPPPVTEADANGNAFIQCVLGDIVAPTTTSRNWTRSSDGGATYQAIDGTSDGGIYSGTSLQTLTITGAGAAQNGFMYSYLVGVGGNHYYSAKSTLLTRFPPTIQGQPADQTDIGLGATFTITTTSASYQWERSKDGGATFQPITANNAATLDAGITYSGWNTNALTEHGATTLTGNGYYYICYVSNVVGGVIYAATSQQAKLTFAGTAPTITQQPTNQNTTGGSADFTCLATGTPSPLYQWQRSVDGITYVSINAGNAGPTGLDTGVTYTGWNSTILSIAGASVAQTLYYYKCIVSNSIPLSVPSNPAQLTFVT